MLGHRIRSVGGYAKRAAIPKLMSRLASTESTSGAITDVSANAPSPVAEISGSVHNAVPELAYSPSDIVVRCLENIHQFLDVPYWGSIAIATLSLRVILSPISIGAIRNGARMAVVRPEVDRIQTAMKADPRGNDMKVMAKYQAETKAVFTKHNVNPLKSMVGPFIQIPIFASMFFGLQKFGDYFHEDYASGGLFWFTDLSAADPYYILPVLNAASFLAMIEIGADGMPNEQQGMFKWVMRGLSVFMVPFTIHLPTVSYCCVRVYYHL